MPTTLPPPTVLPWPALRRALWLKFRASLLNARMKWLPASHERACRNACRWLAYSREMHDLIGRPEPESVAAIRATFEEPFPDGSTLFSRYGERS